MHYSVILNYELFITINNLEIKLLRSLTASSVFDGAVDNSVLCYYTVTQSCITPLRTSEELEMSSLRKISLLE